MYVWELIDLDHDTERFDITTNEVFLYHVEKILSTSWERHVLLWSGPESLCCLNLCVGDVSNMSRYACFSYVYYRATLSKVQVFMWTYIMILSFIYMMYDYVCILVWIFVYKSILWHCILFPWLMIICVYYSEYCDFYCVYAEFVSEIVFLNPYFVVRL